MTSTSNSPTKEYFKQMIRDFKVLSMADNERGGYHSDAGRTYDHYTQENEGDYLIYDIFHAVNVKGQWKTYLPPDYLPFFNLCYEKALSNAKMLKDLNYQEICIRVIYYPQQGRSNGKLHKDICYITVPIYDSEGRVTAPFFSGKAEADGHEALEHRFHCPAGKDRIYIVGFAQKEVFR
jgi:hypothetical protein